MTPQRRSPTCQRFCSARVTGQKPSRPSGGGAGRFEACGAACARMLGIWPNGGAETCGWIVVDSCGVAPSGGTMDPDPATYGEKVFEVVGETATAGAV